MTWMDRNMPETKLSLMRFRASWRRYRREVHLAKAMMDLERAAERLEKVGALELRFKLLLLAIEVGDLP